MLVGRASFLGGGCHHCHQNKHFSGKADVASASSELLWTGDPIFHARNDEKGSTFCQMMLANTFLNSQLVGLGETAFGLGVKLLDGKKCFFKKCKYLSVLTKKVLICRFDESLSCVN